MYIPYDIGEEVYYFDNNSSRLVKSRITRLIISNEEQLVETEKGQNTSFTVPIHRIYPSKAVAKEELLRRAINKANEELIDL